jgi:hypothetical protein
MAENMKQSGMPKPGLRPMEVPPDGVSVTRDMAPLLADIDALIAKQEGGSPMGGAGSMAGESGAMPGTGGTGAEGAGGESAQVIAEVLGVSPEKAQALYDAAMAMPRFAGKSPAEVAEMLDKDMNLRMQLEKNMGAGEDMKMRKSMSEGGMSAPSSAPPPMEPTPSGGMK